MQYELFSSLNEALTALSLALPRILVCLLIVPVLSVKMMHGILRTAVCVGISIPVAMGIYFQVKLVEITLVSMVGFFLKEAVIGVLLGFLLAIPFWLFESIGTVFDTQRGAMMGEQLNPETGSMSSITGLLLLQSAIVLMIELGAFAWMFGLLVNSYIIWPALEWLPPFNQDAGSLLIQEFSALAMQFVMYALPVMASLLIVELVFALVSVYAPQLQVYFLAMPVKSLVGLCVFILMSTVLWQYGQETFMAMKDKFVLLQQIIPAWLKP